MQLNDANVFRNQQADISGFETRLSDMETLLTQIHQMLSNQQVEKDWYTVREVAEILGRSEFTVREWCRLNRVYADKRACGRGHSQEWIISSEELRRVQNEGLLPVNKTF